MRVRSIASVDTVAWSKSGHQGPDWKKALFNSNPSGPFQIMFEGIRGPNFEGDIAIDDVSITKGKCKQDSSVASTVLIGGSAKLHPLLLVGWTTFALLCFLLYR
ncbi:hypothetical protein NHX12_006626 [Muraenolepis orangiensis]|uniref:MAM domain-containing protein n=1 Tax=Muraenolepis orangiensis TaxID=630683 RepID=A0A9Q0IDG2_9TELE|nr:hypothetical protein NHX12_006626 [Muraenolepis orangiensis]